MFLPTCIVCALAYPCYIQTLVNMYTYYLSTSAHCRHMLNGCMTLHFFTDLCHIKCRSQSWWPCLGMCWNTCSLWHMLLAAPCSAAPLVPSSWQQEMQPTRQGSTTSIHAAFMCIHINFIAPMAFNRTVKFTSTTLFGACSH